MHSVFVVAIPYSPSWQEIPILPGMQPAEQLPVTPSQSSKQLQKWLQSGPQRLPGQSVKCVMIWNVEHQREKYVIIICIEKSYRFNTLKPGDAYMRQ